MTTKKKAALGLLLCALIGFVILAAWHYRARHQLDKYKASLVAQGEFLSLTQAWPRPLKGDRQKAIKFLSATTQWKKGSVLDSNQVPLMRPVGFGRAMAGSLRPDIRNNGLNQTNSWDDLAQELVTNQEVLNQIRECLDGSAFDFNLAYSSGFFILLPHLAPAKTTAQKLWMATALALQRQDFRTAETNLLNLLNLSQAMRHDRLIISELVRLAISQIAMNATWEALQHPGWSDDQLTRLQAKWLSMEFSEPMRDSFRMERAMGSDSLQSMRDSPQKFAAAFSPMPGPGTLGSGNFFDFLQTDLPQATRMKFTHLLWHFFWSYQDELRALRIYRIQMDAFRPDTDSWKAVDSELRKGLETLGITNQTQSGESIDNVGLSYSQLQTVLSDGVLNNNRTIRRAFVTETLKEMTVTAIALKRFHMQHGHYPRNLSDLVPDFLQQLPVDYMVGQTLRYRSNADATFTLYSVGEDGIDDNALPPSRSAEGTRGWLLQRDWVWPHLGSQAEIDKYETEQAVKHQRGPRRRTRAKVAVTNNVNSAIQPTNSSSQ